MAILVIYQSRQTTSHQTVFLHQFYTCHKERIESEKRDMQQFSTMNIMMFTLTVRLINVPPAPGYITRSHIMRHMPSCHT